MYQQNPATGEFCIGGLQEVAGVNFEVAVDFEDADNFTKRL